MIQKIHLVNFKSHRDLSLQFDKKITAIIGKNGTGKTNILDAIYFTTGFKSFLNHSDAQLIHFGDHFFRIESRFSNHKEVIATYMDRKKNILIDQVKISKYSTYFAHIPMIVACPSDIFLFYGGSEERRKLIDYTISAIDRSYLLVLNQYNAYLEQRNAYLKQTDLPDKLLVEHYDARLVELGTQIYEARKIFLSQYLMTVNQWYDQIARDRLALEYPIQLEYISQLSEGNYAEKMKHSWSHDLSRRRTTVGIHKDDIEISIQGTDAKKIASQGQQKSILYAMRMAQAEYIYQETKKPCIFLLDDFSDKLDYDRKRNLLQVMEHTECVEQWILTDTEARWSDQKDISLIILD